MSKQSIADKSAIIRNETQKYANTRGRVADVLDDINATKADNVDLEAEATARAPIPPSSCATLFSKTSVVGFIILV